MSGSHEKLPWLFWVQLILVAIVAYLFFINTGKHSGDENYEKSDAHAATKQTLKPIGEVTVGGAEDTASAGGERSGKDIVNKTCQSCHANGIANAPKMDESSKADWEARMSKGLDEMLAVAKKGKGAMPAMGTDPSLSDAELKNAVVYMLEKVGIDAGASASSEAEAPATSTEVEASEASTEASDSETSTAPSVPETPEAPEPPVEAAAITTAVATASPEQAETKEASEASVEAKPSIDSAKLYSTTCFACHSTGAAGAPKLGDKAAWVDRIAQGKEALYKAAIEGKTSAAGVMPAKGGYMNLSDNEVKAIVDHMVSQSE